MRRRGQDEPDCIFRQTDQRTIQLNTAQPVKYASNDISTAKYSLVTFVPKFLFEQFRRYSNVFFLFIALMQQIPDVSPTGRFTTAVPLIMIICVSALKEIVEDFKRHTADDEVNKRPVSVLRDGNWQQIEWKQVKVGDFVKATNGQFFPADLVLLSSSEPQGMCYIETSNLDGETNLKIRQGLPQTASLLTHNQLQELDGTVECELPNRHVYAFVGNIRFSDTRAYPLGPNQLLLRGAILKNTKWVFGIVAYTGHESKLMLNSTSAPLKRSTVELVVNRQTLMLFALLLFIALFSATASEIWSRLSGVNHWYLNLKELSTGNFFYNLLTFVILYNNLIPISLQVTLEIVKFIQAIFINWDRDMYCEETDTPAVARTSNLNEELGQVKYIFSDKTGTLTRNVMEFRKCSIAGIVYGDNQENTDTFADATLLENLTSNHPTSESIREFLTLLAVCHTVVPEKEDDIITYQASSPDERALVLGASALGFVFHTRLPQHVTIEVMGHDESYEVLHVLEFTSARKRMSVIVRTPDGTIKLMTKGADTVIYERLEEDETLKLVTLEHLEEFAKIGLRTLCIATSVISPEFYSQWREIHYAASTTIVDRERKLEEAAELIEKNLHLLGATAIEDKLQDGIPEAIESLSKANIKIWILTGDKQETAINIGYSCRLLTPTMAIILLNEESPDVMTETIKQHVDSLGSQLKKDNNVGLVIDGESLKFALSPSCRHAFLELAVSCRAVICCRASPLQKAEIVELVRNEVHAITLAIGDGANDVGMIQKAHVGVGISGVEGLQAACASDYSIAQFRYLCKLLLVHGAWNYHRLTKLILYSFYKNICLYVIEFWFAILSCFSGQVVFERWSIGLYNVFFTAAPPMAIGLFDRYCSSDSMLQFPALYKSSQSSLFFNVKIFWLWCINAIYHSAILFWFTVLALQQDIAFKDGKIGDYLFLGNMVYTYVVIAVSFKAGLETASWTIFTHIAIWGSIGFWFLFLCIYPHFWPTINLAPEMVGMTRYVFSCPIFWLGLVLIPTATLLRDFVWKVVRRTLFKTEREDVLEMERAHKASSYVALHETKRRVSEKARMLRNVFMRSGRAAERGTPTELQAHGYAFSQEENGIMSQSDLIRQYDTRQVKPGGL